MLAPEGRVIMISGANRGIGRAITETSVSSGIHVKPGCPRPGLA